MPASRALAMAVAGHRPRSSWVRRFAVGDVHDRSSPNGHTPNEPFQSRRFKGGIKTRDEFVSIVLRIVSSTAGETSASERKIAFAALDRDEAVGNAVAGHRLLDEVRIVRGRFAAPYAQPLRPECRSGPSPMNVI